MALGREIIQRGDANAVLNKLCVSGPLGPGQWSSTCCARWVKPPEARLSLQPLAGPGLTFWGPESVFPCPSLAQLHSEVEKPLMNFRENFKKDMKKCDHHIADLRKQLASRYAAVEKVRGGDLMLGQRWGDPGSHPAGLGRVCP